MKKIISYELAIDVQPEESGCLIVKIPQGVVKSSPRALIELIRQQNPDFDQSSDGDCSICLDEIDPPEVFTIQPSESKRDEFALHPFHGDCLEKWIQTAGSPAKNPVVGKNIGAVVDVRFQTLSHVNQAVLCNTKLSGVNRRILTGVSMQRHNDRAERQSWDCHWIGNQSKLWMVSAVFGASIYGLVDSLGTDKVMAYDNGHPGFHGAAVMAGFRTLMTLYGGRSPSECGYFSVSQGVMSIVFASVQEGAAVLDMANDDYSSGFTRLALSTIATASTTYISECGDEYPLTKYMFRVGVFFATASQVLVAGEVVSGYGVEDRDAGVGAAVFFAEYCMLVPIIVVGIGLADLLESVC